MDISTRYLGLDLRSPLVASASPLSETLDGIKRIEDAGAGGVVLYSLFEEQISHERESIHHHLTHHAESFAEALDFFPEPSQFPLGPDEYLEHIANAKKAVDIPVMASLNGSSLGGWTDYATNMQQAGADAIELNIYRVPTSPELASSELEQQTVDIVAAVRRAVTIPVAVKLSPYYTNFAALATQLDAAGADALVLFNRFYQPDIDIEALEVRPHLVLSSPHEARLPLTWIALLWGKVQCDLAATSGVASARDAIKLLMAGAAVTQLASELLRHGIDRLKSLELELKTWMQEQEYESVRQMQGSMSQQRSPDPSAFERAQYMRMLHSWKG